jgi:hypothetical protein
MDKRNALEIRAFFVAMTRWWKRLLRLRLAMTRWGVFL